MLSVKVVIIFAIFWTIVGIHKGFIAITRKPEVEEGSINSLLRLEEILEQRSRVDPLDFQFSYERDSEGKIEFHHKDKNIINRIPLKTIELIRKDNYGYYVWKADKKEYLNIYRYSTKKNKTIQSEVETALALLENDKESMYDYILNEYEIPLATLSTTIEEELEENRILSDEIEKKSIEILQRFISDLQKVKSKADELTEKMKEASIKSRVERLDFELSYLQKRKEG